MENKKGQTGPGIGKKISKIETRRYDKKEQIGREAESGLEIQIEIAGSFFLMAVEVDTAAATI